MRDRPGRAALPVARARPRARAPLPWEDDEPEPDDDATRRFLGRTTLVGVGRCRIESLRPFAQILTAERWGLVDDEPPVASPVHAVHLLRPAADACAREHDARRAAAARLDALVDGAATGGALRAALGVSPSAARGGAAAPDELRVRAANLPPSDEPRRGDRRGGPARR